MNIEITNNTVRDVVIKDPTFQDETLDFAGAGTWPAGAVLGKVTSTGKYVRFDPVASDGSEVAKAVLTEPVTAASAGDKPARPLVSGHIRLRDLVDVNDTALTAGAVDQLRDYTIIAQATTELSEPDNQ